MNDISNGKGAAVAVAANGPMKAAHAASGAAASGFMPEGASTWGLAMLLAGLATLPPFSIDAYLPAFTEIGRELHATPLLMQQTLSAYLFGFAVMALFHGTLSDSFGRRPVVLAGLGLFIVASIGCSMARDAWDLTAWRAIQGMASGVGTAVGRAMTRDLFEERHARRVMSQITMLFGIAPVIAPIIGAWLFVYLGWIAIFWFLALLGLLLFALSWRKLPESLPPGGRQPFRVGPLMAGYKTLATDERLALFCLAGGMPFSALFLYIFSTPSFLGMHLGLLPTQYFWFFVSIVSGTMLGAHLGGRLSGRISAMRQVSIGYAAMIVVVVLNALYHGLFAPQSVPAIILLGAYAIGLSLMAPGVAVLALDLHPTRRGMTSSLQMFIGQFINAIMASLIVPYVLDSTAHMAWMMAGFIAIGFMAWMALGWRHGLTHHAKAGG